MWESKEACTYLYMLLINSQVQSFLPLDSCERKQTVVCGIEASTGATGKLSPWWLHDTRQGTSLVQLSLTADSCEEAAVSAD